MINSNFIMLQKEDLREVVAALVEELVGNSRMENNNSDIESKYLTRDEVCACLHITYTTLWRRENAGHIKARKVGHRNLYLKSDVEKLVAEKEVKQ